MQTKKAVIYGAMALVLISLVASGASASHFGEEGKSMHWGSKALKNAINEGDYDAYMNALEGTGKEPIDKEAFDDRFTRFQEMATKKAEMQAAIDSGDYNAWLSAIDGTYMEEKLSGMITEDNFDTFVELHQAKKDKDWEKVKALSAELGFEKTEGKKGFMGGHMGHDKGHVKTHFCNQK